MAKKHHRVALFDNFLLKINAFYCVIILVSMGLLLNNHQTNVSGKDCNAQDYKLKFQRVLIWELVTLFLFFTTTAIGGTTIIYMTLKEAYMADQEEMGLKVDEKSSPKYVMGEVIALALAFVSHICFMFAAYFLYQYKIAEISCLY